MSSALALVLCVALVCATVLVLMLLARSDQNRAEDAERAERLADHVHVDPGDFTSLQGEVIRLKTIVEGLQTASALRGGR